MAAATGSHTTQVDDLFRRLEAHKVILRGLNEVIEKLASDTFRQDQLKALDVLRHRIASQIKDLKLLETSTACGIAQANLVGGLAGLVLGTVTASVRGAEKPILDGLSLSQQMLGRRSPSGSIMVAIRDKPLEINPVSVSKVARDLAINEVEAVKSLKAQGYSVLSIGEFYQLLDRMQAEMTNGTSSPSLGIQEKIIRYCTHCP